MYDVYDLNTNNIICAYKCFFLNITSISFITLKCLAISAA